MTFDPMAVGREVGTQGTFVLWRAGDRLSIGDEVSFLADGMPTQLDPERNCQLPQPGLDTILAMPLRAARRRMSLQCRGASRHALPSGPT